MHIIKRDGQHVLLQSEKIATRIRTVCDQLNSSAVSVEQITRLVLRGCHDNMTSNQIDELASETAAYLATEHPEYANLAARLAMTNLHKNTEKSFAESMTRLRLHRVLNAPAPLVSEDIYILAQKHAARIEQEMSFERDYDYDYFGVKTLVTSYLLRINGKTVERPQHMHMRIALGIHGADIDSAIETYTMLSKHDFTHATPTMFNAGTPSPAMSSCFLVGMHKDSIEGIYKTLGDCAAISASAGGIGLSVSSIRAEGSYIRGSGGTSSGLVPMLRVFDATAKYVDQGGGKRKGAFAVYIEPWHADIGSFLELKLNHGAEDRRARDLSYGLWIPDLFMARVDNDESWSLFCPHECPGLVETHGDEFNRLYEKYEHENKAREKISAQKLWRKIVMTQIETGMPYMLYKDSCNRKSNQRHLGTIQCSNLCTEIIEYSSPTETAVCNLASISLPSCVDQTGFNVEKLQAVTRVITRNLNRVIDQNQYPTVETKRSNYGHRPIGIGVQGLADVFMLLKMPFESEQARSLNRTIFETIYFSALDMSCELAKIDGPYESYAGSPTSEGILQFDMWNISPSDDLDWSALRARIRTHGLRNSLLIAPMPTASTAQILGNNECFEPYTSNMYMRRVLSGEFVVVNRHLVRDLEELGLWSDDIRQQIQQHNGSIQQIENIPNDIKELYKTVWEMKMRTLIDMAADRAAFIDQSQSLNLFMETPSYQKITSMHFYAWRKGLKTGMYYLRTQGASEALKFTVENAVCTRYDNSCESCSG